METHLANVEILADSVNLETGDRLTTFLIHNLWKPLLGELARHRVLSLNAASSRAIPIGKIIQSVIDSPFVPEFTANKPGMSGSFISDEVLLQEAKFEWLRARDNAVESAKALALSNIHKQQANRLLEPFLTVPVLITATDWDNFWELRCDTGAQPEFRAIALEMRRAYKESKPIQIKPGEWHIPFREGIPIVVSDPITENVGKSLASALKIATARAARLSYKNHLGEISYSKDFELHDRLLASKHLSPFEHCAKARPTDIRCRNFSGFRSYRAHLEDSLSIA